MEHKFTLLSYYTQSQVTLSESKTNGTINLANLKTEPASAGSRDFITDMDSTIVMVAKTGNTTSVIAEKESYLLYFIN
jgi:hypothetical protein